MKRTESEFENFSVNTEIGRVYFHYTIGYGIVVYLDGCGGQRFGDWGTAMVYAEKLAIEHDTTIYISGIEDIDWLESGS